VAPSGSRPRFASQAVGTRVGEQGLLTLRGQRDVQMMVDHEELSFQYVR